MSLKVSNIIRKLIFTGSLFWAVSAQAQQDSLFLSVEQLFESGIKSSLQLQSDSLKERMAHERKLYAKTGLLPDLEIGLKGGIIGQPVVFQNGLSNPTYPDTPDWSQNYTVDFNQPLYQGGKIRRSIQKADIETEIARLLRMTNQADIKLGLLNQYLTLFTLFKQHLVLTRNIEESERRLQDIRQMKKEGLITNNDVLRSEMQLTNDRLSLQETENSIHIVSQQLNLLLGNDRNPIITPDTTLLQQATPLDSYDDYLLSAYEQAPDMQLLRKETELAQNQIEIDRASRRPNINLYASNTLARPITRTMTDLYNNNWNIGLSVSYPLSSLFKNGHKIKESQLQVAVQKKRRRTEKTTAADGYLQRHPAPQGSLAGRRSLGIVGPPGTGKLPHHAKPLHEPAGHTHRPAGCQFRVAQCRTTTDFFTHQNHLHLLPAAKSLRKIITSLNYKEYDATRYTQETPEKKTAEHPAQLSMYSDCRLRTDMGGQLLLEIHSL